MLPCRRLLFFTEVPDVSLTIEVHRILFSDIDFFSLRLLPGCVFLKLPPGVRTLRNRLFPSAVTLFGFLRLFYPPFRLAGVNPTQLPKPCVYCVIFSVLFKG